MTRRTRIPVPSGFCSWCEQPFPLSIAYRCVGCDDAVCVLCVVERRDPDRATRDRWCPACLREEG